MLHTIGVTLAILLALVLVFRLYAVWNNTRHHHRYSGWTWEGVSMCNVRQCRTCGWTQVKF